MTRNMVDTSGLDKGAVLAALYNASKPQGMGFLHYDPSRMSVEDANTLLSQWTHFDYLYGRVMKVDLGADDEFDPWLYDRDLSEGAAAQAVATVRA